MSDVIKKLADLDNVIIDVKISAQQNKAEYLGMATVSIFDPNNHIPNGGPCTKKQVNVQAEGVDYNDAYDQVLNRAVELLGL